MIKYPDFQRLALSKDALVKKFSNCLLRRVDLASAKWLQINELKMLMQENFPLDIREAIGSACESAYVEDENLMLTLYECAKQGLNEAFRYQYF